MSPLLLVLPAAFKSLSLESAGSPAPWITVPAAAPLRYRVVLAALISLSRALAESSEQSSILAAAISRAREAYDVQREACQVAKDAVLSASKAAQAAHAEAKRVEKLNGVFREGADRTVAALDRKLLRSLRKGKGRALEVPLPPAVEFVEELVVDLDLDEAEILASAEGVELDEEWQAVEEDLVYTIAARAEEKASPRLPASLQLPGEEPRDLDTISLPPTPPASIHSADSCYEEERDPPCEELPAIDLFPLLRPIVHPVIVLLFHLHRTTSTRLSASVDHFEELVRLSAVAVDTHRQASLKVNKTAVKLRDLRELEIREREEELQALEELRTTVVELARWVLKKVSYEAEEVEGAGQVEED
ncbi:hypothetical protein JCM11641_004787 [Rhodosporidiobolus odoratus]